MTTVDQEQLRHFNGRVIHWEPASRGALRFRRFDSDSLAASVNKQGKILIEGQRLVVMKSRWQAQVMAFVLSATFWLGGFIGLAVLFDSISDVHPILFSLLVLPPLILVTVWLIRRLIPSLWRSYPLSEIVNVQIKHVDILKNNRLVRQGRLGVDLTIAPLESRSAIPRPDDGVRIESHECARVDGCRFLTFVAENEAQATLLKQLLPGTAIPLSGPRQADIPPQEAAPVCVIQSASSQSESGYGDHPDSVVGREERYSHDFKFWYLFVGLLIFGGFLASSIRTVLTNQRGLIINGVIKLGPTGATIFYFCETVLFGLMSLLLLCLIIRRVVNPHFVVMNSTGLTFLEGFLKPRRNRVQFQEIQAVVQKQPLSGGARTLLIQTVGRQYKIDESRLPSRRDYEQILASVRALARVRPEMT